MKKGGGGREARSLSSTGSQDLKTLSFRPWDRAKAHCSSRSKASKRGRDEQLPANVSRQHAVQ